jgi:hypothetical protein
MITSEIELYELLTQQLGAEKAKVVVRYVEAKVDSRLEEKKAEFILERDKDKLLTKADALMIFATKEDLAREISNLRADLLKTIYLVGIVQFIGIVGSLLAILKFMK